MDIEILKTFINLNDNDVYNSVKLFINKPEILNNYNHINDNKLYLNDNIIAINKSNLQNDIHGIIIDIGSDGKLCISKRGNHSSIFIMPEKYYIFIKQTKNKNNDRMFYQKLLQLI